MVHRRSSSNNNLETNYVVESNNHENVTERKTSTSKVESSNAKPNSSNNEGNKLEEETKNVKKDDSRSKKTSPKINNIKEAATLTTNTKNSNKTRLNATVHESASTKNENGSANDENDVNHRDKRSSKEDVITPKIEVEDPNISVVKENSSKGIICSLPLERLSGILETLTQSKENASNSSNKCLEVQNTNKILCLYCDRAFSSQKLHTKHTERAHKLSEGRRSSIRNTSNNNGTSNSPTSSSSTSSSSAFSGCSFCISNKLSPMVAEDLDILFNHILDSHNDKYFACRECTTRFINEDNLNNHLKHVHNQEIPQKKPSLPVTKPLSVIVDFEDEIIARMQVSKREMDDVRLTRNAVKSMQDSHLSAKEQMLMRLGIAQHRSPRTRKGAKNRRGAPTEGNRSEVYRSSRSRCGRSSVTNLNSSEQNEFVIQRTKNEVLNCTFDEDFYETVSNNVRLNLSCHLDGKLDSNPTAPSPLSPVSVCPTVRSTVVHNPLNTDSEIHEATSLSTTTAFPTLLTADQYGTNVSTSHNKYKKPTTKNSWKWKWDLVKKYKYVNEGGKIVKKVKQPTSGLRDLSKLDMWTQLVMRKKHEDLVAASEELEKEDLSSTVRQEKRRIVEQLNCILDKRLLPQINVEQDEQRVIKPDPDENDTKTESTSIPTKSYDVKHFPEMLHLLPATQVTKSKLILSGEWARPRCYICFCCGSKFDTIKHLEEHKSGRHPHINCTHYEVVGRELIEKQFYSNFYLPVKALEQNHLAKNGPVSVTENEIVARLKEKEATISVEDSMDSVTSTSVSVVTSNTTETDSNTKSSSKTCTTASSSVQPSPHKSSCSKCNKETNSLLDLHRHILDCSGDYAWAQVKKRLKYRRLLGKKRRVSRGLNIVRRPKSLSKTDDDKDDEKDGNESPKPKPPPTPKVRPSDKESIQRMLANLPPKRTCRQILSLNNQTIRRKIQSKAMQPQINLKREEFDSPVSSQNDKKSDSSQKSERKSLRSSASSTSSTSNSSSSKETTPIKEDSPVKSGQKKGFIKQVHAKARSVIRNLSKTFSKSPSKRLTRSSNNSSPEVIKDEESKSREHEIKQVELSKSDEGEEISVQKAVSEVHEKSKTDNVEVIGEISYENKNIDEKSTEIEKQNLVPLDEKVESNENMTTSKSLFSDSKNEAERSEATNESNVPEIVKEDQVKMPVAVNRRSNRRKGPARKSICVIGKDYESDSNETNQPTIKTTVNKINPDIKTLLQKNATSFPLENIPLSIPSNTQLTITVSPQPGSSSSLLTPISGPSTNVGESFTPLSSPALRTSTESLIKTPPGKRKAKKLTDCIAMLTGKLQVHQPNPFIEPISPPILSPVHREVPKMVVTQVNPVQLEPEPEAMDLSATRPKWVDGVLDLSKKPAIRHSVENMISPVSHRSSLSPSFMSPPPPQLPESPFMTNKQPNFNSSFSYSLPNLTPPISDFSKTQSSTSSSNSKRKSSTPKVSKEPELLNIVSPPMMGSPPLDLPPAAVLSMIGLGVPAITIPLTLPLPFPPPPPINIMDFGPQQSSTPIIIPEISTPNSSSKSTSSRRNKPKPRNLRNETEIYENKTRTTDILNSDLPHNNKTTVTKYSTAETILDSIEAVVKQSAIEAETSQKFDSTFVPLQEIIALQNSTNNKGNETKITHTDSTNLSKLKDSAEKIKTPSDESKTEKDATLCENVSKTVSLNESKSKKSLKASKEVVTSQTPIVNPVISKDTDFEELIDQVRSPPANSETLNKTDDEEEKDERPIEKSNSPTTDEDKSNNSARTRGRRGGKKKISIEKQKEAEPEVSKGLSEKTVTNNSEKHVENKVQKEDVENHNVVPEKSIQLNKVLNEKESKNLNKSRNNSPTVRKSIENKSRDEMQLAKISYRRKSIRLLGIDPDLAEFYDEPIERNPQKPSNKKKPTQKEESTVDFNKSPVQEKDNNLMITEPELRKSPRRSHRNEKPNISPSINLPDNTDNPSDDEPLSKKVLIDKLKRSPTKKMPPKKRDSARKIVDSPIPEIEKGPEVPAELEKKSVEDKEINLSSNDDKKSETELSNKKPKGRPRKDKKIDTVAQSSNDTANQNKQNDKKPNETIAKSPTEPVSSKDSKKGRSRSSKTISLQENVVEKNSPEHKEETFMNLSQSVPTEIESDKIGDSESLKENQLKTVKARKKRKNELAAIIADQLLESFKEVDNSRKDELKILHDLSCEKNENNDELLVSAIRTTPVPRRKAAAKAKDAMESESESRLTSPARKKAETQNTTTVKEIEPVQVMNNNKNTKTESETSQNIKKPSKLSKKEQITNNVKQILEQKIETEKPNESIVENIEISKDKTLKMQDSSIDEAPSNKKARVNNSKKKFTLPSIPSFIDDEEISFKRTTRKQFAQEIAILNQMKLVAKKPEVEATLEKTAQVAEVVEVAKKDEQTQESSHSISSKTQTISKNTKESKSKPKVSTKLSKNTPESDESLNVVLLPSKPAIRTRKLSIELEDLNLQNKKSVELAKEKEIEKNTKSSEPEIKVKNNKQGKEKVNNNKTLPIETKTNENKKQEAQMLTKLSKNEIIPETAPNSVKSDNVIQLKQDSSNFTKSVINTRKNKASPSLDLDISESLEKLDKTKKVTERNAILSDLFDHLKDDAKKSNDADSSGFETDMSKNSSNTSTKTKQTKTSKKVGNNKKTVQKNPVSENLKLCLENTEPSVDKMAALNIFCKGLDIPIVSMTSPESTPISPTNNSSRSIFLRPSALDKVLDNKNDVDTSKLEKETETPKRGSEPLRTSLRNKRPSTETTPVDVNKTPKRRNSVRNEKDNKLKSPKLNDTPSKDAFYPSSFPELSFNDDDDESSLKINEIVNNLINQAEMSESDDEKLPLAQTMRSSHKKRVSIEEIPTTIVTDNLESKESVSDYDDNANTDMDDDCSVITDYTICRNEAEGKIGSRIPRKRKHRKSVLCKKRKVAKKETNENTEEFNCGICKKNFKKAEGLSKHKMTLSHIAKLSEIEYIMSQKEKENTSIVQDVHKKEVTPEPPTTVKDLFLSERPESPIISKPNTPDILIPGYSPHNSPSHHISRSPLRSPPGIEPISSPEHIEPNYDRQNSLIRKAADNSRVQLNSEERLFYEVCSMLKSTKQNKGDTNTGYTQKTNDISSNLTDIQHHVGYSVKSPPTHSRSSPKAAFPKNDMNQFSDISSDSNPHIFRRQTKASKPFTNYVSPHQNHLDSAAMENKNAIVRQEYYDSFSDMGDSFHSDSDNEILTQLKPSDSIAEGAQHINNRKFLDSDKESPISSPNLETKSLNPVYASSLHSTASSRNSNVSRIKTKAAMKGFDNFKVSIPTTGLDMDNVKKSEGVAEFPPDKKIKNKIKETPPTKRMFKNKTQKSKVSRTPTANKKQLSNSLIDSTSKDIYTFDDSQDSTDKPLQDIFRSTKSTKSSSKPSSELDKTIQTSKDPEIIENDESQQSSTSFSDRDDFVYGDNNHSSESTSESSDSSVSTAIKAKEPKKPDHINLQKKNLMMAKIFSKKKDGVPKQKTPENKKVASKHPKIDRDKLFDILKAENERKQEAKRIASSDGKGEDSLFDSKDAKRSLSPKSKKSREIADIEAEWGMSMKEIEKLIGVGSRKPKRRCTNRPKNLVETWSSDEYEDFHTTKDIIALIEDAEKKAQRKIRSSSKNNENQTQESKIDHLPSKDTKEVTFEKLPEPQPKKKVTIMANQVSEGSDNENVIAEKTKKVQKKKATIAKPDKIETKPRGRGRKKGSLSNKPKNIAYDSDSDFEHHIKPSVKKTATIKQRRCTIAAPVQSESDSDDSIKTLPAKVWNAKNKEKLKVIQKSKEAEDTKPMGRRKRVASEMLYYWSSSSDDDEFGKISAPPNNIDEDESQDSDDHQQQHGWIVGDSHKKLVTLLAHAKAKKVDDSGGKKK